MVLLITGIAGFIGSNFLKIILDGDPSLDIIGLDALTYAADMNNLNPVIDQINFVEGDISDMDLVESIFKNYKIDGVINFAAESHVDRSIEDPMIFLRSNVIGVGTLLEVAKKYWMTEDGFRDGVRFLQVSTDEVYGSLGEQGLFTEKTPLDPKSPYSASKAAGDHLVLAYHNTYRMPVVITRCSNNYGPHQDFEKLIPKVISHALKHNLIPIYGDGKQIRDWLFVDDHCRGIDLVYKKGRVGEVYNIGGNNERMNIELVKTILKILSERISDPEINESLITFVEDRLGHDRRYGIDPSKIQAELGWSSQISFEDGISDTIDWYLSKINN